MPRWLSSEIAEYDPANKLWTNSAIKYEVPPFSTSILGDQELYIVGGLDDS